MKRYFFKSSGLFLSNILAIAISSIVSIYMAYILKEVTDISYGGNLQELKSMFFIMCVYSILTFLTTLAKRILKIKLTKEIMYNLKNDIFNSLISKNISSFNSSNTANYISAINNDTNLIEQDYFSSIIDNIDYILTFIFATYSILKLNIYVALSILITGCLPLIIPVIFQKELGYRRKSHSDMIGLFTGKIKDIFSGFEVVKSFNIEDKVSQDFYNSNNSLELKKYKASEFLALINSISLFLGFIMYFAPLGIGVYLVLKGQFTTGGVIASVQLSNHVVNPISNLSNIISRLKSIKPINQKIEDLILENNQSDDGLSKTEFNNKISFKNINFSYNADRKILNNISLEINKGEKVAIVGSSGSGKSTFLKLLLRYYENYTGDIKIDDINSKSLNLSSLYSLISIIQQNVFMFDDTIESNISLYGNYSEADIDKVINLSGLNNLISNLPNGKNSLVGENGSNLSGGEKQRISIARALIKNTPIILLDEATASLDSKTAYDIEMSLLSIKELTSIVITHKLNEEVLKKYDKIIVLDKGHLVEFGSFDELIENNSFFHKLFNIEKAA